jgi:hypothetical protein
MGELMQLVLLLLMKLAAGFLACLAFKQRESVVGWFGIGYLGNLVASGARAYLGVGVMHGLGFFDPLLWMIAGSALVVLFLKLLGRVARSVRGRVLSDDSRASDGSGVSATVLRGAPAESIAPNTDE